jgi:hypothetical protein
MKTRYLALAALVAVGGAVSTLPASAMPADTAAVVSCQDICVMRTDLQGQRLLLQDQESA